MEEKIIFRKRDAVSPQKISIRKYRREDNEAVRRICCETGLLGKPIDTIYKDRELFADLITGPYLRYEPEQALIAENSGQVVGYLLGSATDHFGLVSMFCGFNTMCRMLVRLFGRKYKDHPRSIQFVRWVLLKGIKERPKHPENAGHLHINLIRAYRGRTIANHLWDNYETMMKEAGIKQIYGEFYSYARRRPEIAYSRYGFRLFDRCETTMFQPEIREPVSVICMIKDLP